MLISEKYRELNRKLHEERPDYGCTSSRYIPEIQSLAEAMGAQEILDYGCGKALLSQAVSRPRVINYDPAIGKWAGEPDPADLVVCIDVLEHVEPDCLEAVIRDLRRVTCRIGFFTVATKPAKKTLADGRNAHLIVENYRWWLPRIWEFFDVQQFLNQGPSFLVIVRAK